MNGIRQARAGRMIALCAALALVASCSSDGGTGPSTSALSLGGVANASNGQSLQVVGGTGGGEFVLVVTDTALVGTGKSTYTLTTSGISAPGTVSLPANTLVPSSSASFASLASVGPVLDIAYGSRMNERHRQTYQSLMHGARATQLAQRDLVPNAAAQVGDMLTLNVNESSCDSVINHQARVAAVGTKAIVVTDLANPAGGFTDADYARFAANFDTLIYSVDVTNFGAPSDVDANGRVILFFTRAVNELTPRGSPSYVGGFFSSRDLFPKVATARAQACPASNVAEMFYLLAPDPTGAVNGNSRSTGFVDSLTTGVVGHEFQHLINASRRLYVNNASAFEDIWLNEGLSHIAEELLFYRQSGLAPRQNLSATQVGASRTTVNAFNQDQASNASRYRLYLAKPSETSPYRTDDSLSTRGGTWNFLRYAVDRKLRAGGTDDAVLQALVNSTAVGIPNLRAVFGADLGGMVRDWSVSHYTDDYVTAATVDVTQPSWNWHALFPKLGTSGTYPLQILPLTAASTTATIVPGGAAFYRFSVAANASASISVSGGTPQTGLPQGTVVRIR